ncbi:MAG: hypothetical protein QM704_12840 [Anaeromyxobacteraceae bacterium]
MIRWLALLPLALALAAPAVAEGRPRRSPPPRAARERHPAAPPPPSEPADAEPRRPAKALEVRYRPVPLTTVHDGGTVRIPFPPGSILTVGGESFELLNVHLHAPGADAHGGKHPLAVHLVHLGGDERPVVLTVIVDPGPPNALLAALAARLPVEPGETRTFTRTQLDPAQLLPRDLVYVQVDGPADEGCTPGGARRLVLAARLTASKPQLDALHRLLAPPAPERPRRPGAGRHAP